MRGQHPSVFVVDSHANLPPVVPRQRRRKAGVVEVLLFLLVSVALIGMSIEAYFIYSLHESRSDSSSSFAKVIGEKGVTPTAETVVLPSKPVAHLTGGRDIAHGKGIMAWKKAAANTFLFEMDHVGHSLIVQKEGYYYVYSKVSFADRKRFQHSVDKHTKRFSGGITLLQSRKYSTGSDIQANSYLGGVFHLYKDDALSVHVSNTSRIVNFGTYENVFGAFML